MAVVSNTCSSQPGKDIDILLDPRNLKRFLGEALQHEYGPRFFAGGNSDCPLPNPGLFIEDHGSVGLPLCVKDAAAIISKSKQSGFGKGSRTCIDDSVRRSWELNPGQFFLRNIKWHHAITNILDWIRERLNHFCAKENLHAELYKLLLYDQGAFFKSHQDSEKKSEMFGTLIVALPSSHQGGELCLKHQKDSFNFATAPNSDFGFSWAAWFSDMFHEVLPVTQGFRLVLTYNLVIRNASDAIASAGSPTVSIPANLGGFDTRVEVLFRGWNTQLESGDESFPRCLIHCLDHGYTHANLKLQNLKGRDRQLVERLQAASEATETTLYLASMERHVLKDDEGLDEIIDSDLYLDYIATLDGTKISTHFCLNELNLLQEEDETDWREPDREEHSGFTGNEGCTADYWYRDTVIAIVPSSTALDFTFQGDDRYRQGLERLSELKAQAPHDAIAEKKLFQLAKKIVEKHPVDDDFLYPMIVLEHEAMVSARNEVALLALERGQLELYDKAFSVLEKKLSSECLCKLGESLALLGEEMLKPRIDSALEIQDWVSSKYDAYEKLAEGYARARPHSCSPEAVRECHISLLEQILFDNLTAIPRPVRKADGVAVAQASMAIHDHHQRSKLQDLVISAPLPVKVGFCLCLSQGSDTKTPHDNNLNITIQAVLNSIWGEFKLNNAAVVALLPPDSRQVDEIIKHIITARELSNLITLTEKNLEELQLTTETLYSKIENACQECPAKDFDTTLIPLVKLILSKPEPFTSGLNASLVQEVRPLLSTIVHRYVTAVVGKEPQPPTDWSYAGDKGGCPCGDCSRVNRFLESPTARVAAWPMNKMRRSHLHFEFSRRSSFCSFDVLTLRATRPRTWQITKNRCGYQAQLRGWKNRLMEGKETLNKLDGPNKRLKDILGDSYRAVMACSFEETMSSFERLMSTKLSTSKNSSLKRPALSGDSASTNKRRGTR